MKSQQMRKIFYGVNQGTMYYRFMKKFRDQKSHAKKNTKILARIGPHKPLKVYFEVKHKIRILLVHNSPKIIYEKI